MTQRVFTPGTLTAGREFDRCRTSATDFTTLKRPGSSPNPTKRKQVRLDPSTTPKLEQRLTLSVTGNTAGRLNLRRGNERRITVTRQYSQWTHFDAHRTKLMASRTSSNSQCTRNVASSAFATTAVKMVGTTLSTSTLPSQQSPTREVPVTVFHLPPRKHRAEQKIQILLWYCSVLRLRTAELNKRFREQSYHPDALLLQETHGTPMLHSYRTFSQPSMPYQCLDKDAGGPTSTVPGQVAICLRSD